MLASEVAALMFSPNDDRLSILVLTLLAPFVVDRLDPLPVVSMDERLLTRCREIIDARLDDDELTVEAYARAVGLSRAHLHRRLKALTGLSPSEFIRDHRLRRGAELLRGRHGNVTEVTYAVGFKNPSHFARCFRESFGIAPSAFARDDADSGVMASASR
jgi:AraC-like DNA-binding protein